MRRRRAVQLILCLALSGAACDARHSRQYRLFESAHNAIHPGMSLGQVFDAGLAAYIADDGPNTPGSTVSNRQPASVECTRHVIEIMRANPGFLVRVYCNMNGPSDRQLVPERRYATTHDFVAGLGRDYATWLRYLEFGVQSPALQIGGVYDTFTFSIDGNGTVDKVSALRKAN